jgi:acyl carrier protein
MPSQITLEVIAVIANVLKKDREEINETFSFEMLGADSLDMFEMILKWEDVFLIEISDDEFEKMKLVSDVVRLIEDKNKQKKEP